MLIPVGASGSKINANLKKKPIVRELIKLTISTASKIIQISSNTCHKTLFKVV
jgi:hypothetical protein